MQGTLTVVGAKCKVNFDEPNSLASVLGSEYGVGRHARENLTNIMSVNTIATLFILRTCVVYKFQLPIFLPKCQFNIPSVTVDLISTLSVRLTDQHGKLLDLRGEELNIRFHLQR